MSIHRRDPRRDENEKGIVAALRKAGAIVCLVNGHGVPDLLVGYVGRTYLLEVKLELLPAFTPTGKVRGDKARIKGRDLNPAQREFFDKWRGGKIAVVRNARQALWAIGAVHAATEELDE